MLFALENTHFFWECNPTMLWVSDSLSESEAQSYNPAGKGTTGLENQLFPTLSWALNALGEKICADGVLKHKSPAEEESRRVISSGKGLKHQAGT